MTLLIVLLPLINYVLFVLFGGLVARKTLANFVIVSMFGALAYLISFYSAVISGNVYTTTLGN